MSITDTAVIYQLFLRPFTNEGTLKAAEKLLPHIASLGADIVYLCPVFAHDDDPDRAGWSARQRQSGLDNPKNVYRMKDYYHVDPEYGTDEDLKDFIAAAHSCGMKVMLDLVYFHCGPNAVFLSEHPDFIVRNPDGTPALGQWCFPKLNFDDPALREYLWNNMTYYVRDFGCDGYRCDVGDGVPIDFWREGVRRIREIRPDVIMLNEGSNKEWTHGTFDLSYDFGFHGVMASVLGGPASAETVAEYRKAFTEEHLSPGARAILCYDNHDISNDQYHARYETSLGFEAVNVMLLLCFTMDGVPFLYNGDEIADENRHSIWGSRETKGNLTIDWQNALTEKGQARLKLIRELASLHRTDAVARGTAEYPKTGSDAVLAYVRRSAEEALLFIVNMKNAAASVKIGESDCAADPIFGSAERNGDSILLPPYGYAVYRIS